MAAKIRGMKHNPAVDARPTSLKWLQDDMVIPAVTVTPPSSSDDLTVVDKQQKAPAKATNANNKHKSIEALTLPMSYVDTLELNAPYLRRHKRSLASTLGKQATLCLQRLTDILHLHKRASCKDEDSETGYGTPSSFSSSSSKVRYPTRRREEERLWSTMEVYGAGF